MTGVAYRAGQKRGESTPPARLGCVLLRLCWSSPPLGQDHFTIWMKAFELIFSLKLNIIESQCMANAPRRDRNHFAALRSGTAAADKPEGIVNSIDSLFIQSQAYFKIVIRNH